MLHMLRSMVGENNFFAAITTYFTENSFLNTVSRDLWKHLEQPARERGLLKRGVTIQSVMETWVNNSGFPEVSVVRDYESNSVTLYQFRFGWQWTPNNTEEAAMMWPLWISYHSPGIPDSSRGELLSAVRSQRINLPLQLYQKPVVFNKEAGSYIRVRYDARSLCKLAKLLKENHTRMSVVERAQLLEDVTPLSMPNPKCKPCGIAGWVHMMEYLKGERNLVPWKIAIRKMVMLYATLKGQRVQQTFYYWMMSLTRPYFIERGYKMENEKTEEEKLLKQTMFNLDCLTLSTNPSSPCVKEAFSQFKGWIARSGNSTINPISPYLRKDVYRTVLKFSSSVEDANFILGKYEEAKKLRFRHLEHFKQLKAAYTEFVQDEAKGSEEARSLSEGDHSMDTFCSNVIDNELNLRDADAGIKVLQDCWFKIQKSQGDGAYPFKDIYHIGKTSLRKRGSGQNSFKKSARIFCDCSSVGFLLSFEYILWICSIICWRC